MRRLLWEIDEGSLPIWEKQPGEVAMMLGEDGGYVLAVTGPSKVIIPLTDAVRWDTRDKEDALLASWEGAGPDTYNRPVTDPSMVMVRMGGKVGLVIAAFVSDPPGAVEVESFG